MSYFEGFSIDVGGGQFVFLQVDPFQVGDAIEGLGWDAADVVTCGSEELQSDGCVGTVCVSVTVTLHLLSCIICMIYS